MEDDLIIFFSISAIVFIAGMFLFFIENKMHGNVYKNKEKIKLPDINNSMPRTLWRPSSYKSIENKISKIYGYPEEMSEFRGYIELLEKELVFNDPNGGQLFKIPYDKILKCYMAFPGDLESRSSLRLAILPGWWKLPIPIIAKRHYLRLLIREDGAEKLLNFTFNDKVYSYLKELCQKINNKITL